MHRKLIAAVAGLTVLTASAFTPALSMTARADTGLTGAGSTFDFPFFDSAFKAYGHGVTVNYQPIGSGAGIQQFTAKLVDFGASDVPMNPATELPKAVAAGGAVEQIPVALGGVAVAYNIPGVKSGALHLDGPTLAQIYLGTITRWNDKRIKKLNPKLKLPNLNITPVHRSDSSGTSYAFSDYLAKVSDQARQVLGVSKTPNFPGGAGGQGNLGVAQLVQQTAGAIGYVELAYVLQNRMKEAAIKNRAGQFELPTLKTVAADAASFSKVSATNFSISNGKGKGAYPIATYSWLLVFKKQSDAAKGKALITLSKWLVTTAQSRYGKPLGYVPLPKPVQDLAVGQIKKITT